MGLDANAARTVDRARRTLARLIDDRSPSRAPTEEEALLRAILTGFPDRVARRRAVAAHLERGSEGNLIFASSGTASLAQTSVVRTAPLVVAVDASEQRGRTVVRLASAIEPEWLLELYPERIRETDEVVWNAEAERVEASGKLLYDDLVLDESKGKADPARAAALLADQALARGAHAFAPEGKIDELIVRSRIAHDAMAEIPALGDEEVRAAMLDACAGLRSFAELRDAGLVEHLRARLGPRADDLARLCPDRVRLARGREPKVEYEPGKPPWIASRLQDFFGMREGPRIVNGRVPLVLHLLAPNQRAVQVTTDLAGFWERHYPSIRRELMRRYPRHAWPEDPLA
jgi:ATP-dependent helicase HrpB